VKTVRFKLDGAVDPSFASAPFEFGKQTGGGNDVGTAIALQSDGKVIVGGFGPFGLYLEFGVARLNTDGSLDQSFGTSGGVITPFSTKVSDGTSVTSFVVQPDGKILAAGIALNLSGSPGTIALARYPSYEFCCKSPFFSKLLDWIKVLFLRAPTFGGRA
jgi:uncharacterized delta-60 repeat protein